MTEYQREIVKIKRTFLGWDDHGIPTATLHLEGRGLGISVGGYDMRYYGWDWIGRLLEALGAGSWEELPGKTIFVLLDGNRSVGVENLPTERGFRHIFKDFSDEFQAGKVDT